MFAIFLCSEKLNLKASYNQARVTESVRSIWICSSSKIELLPDQILTNNTDNAAQGFPQLNEMIFNLQRLWRLILI